MTQQQQQQRRRVRWIRIVTTIISSIIFLKIIIPIIVYSANGTSSNERRSKIVTILSILFILINTISILLFGFDKALSIMSKKLHFRISERTLYIWTIIGGIFGTYIGMELFYHKRSKQQFRSIIYRTTIVQGIIIFVLLLYYSISTIMF